ncbi:MAG: DUF4340 domain-containing protein [Verrucomicrobia bacterium]|nr:DUF4340 domain-containing protein [Verrucomicrobiota bacterium]
MKPRTTLLLLAIAILLGCFIFALDRFSQNKRERQERSAHVVEINRNDVEGITIHNGDVLIKVKAEDDGWKMVAPWQDDADSGLIDQLLDAAQNLRPEDVITDLGKGNKKREMLKDFGLNKSKIRLKLDGKRMPAELEFGQDTAVPGSGYLRIAEDDAVYVVNNDLKNIASKTAEDFRDHRMTPFLTTLINRVIFQISGGEIELAKEQDNWQLVRPIKARASNDAVVEILTKMNQTQISKFVPENNLNPGSFGLDTPADVLTLYGGEGKKFEIAIGSTVPSDPETVYAGLPDRNTVVKVNKSFAILFNITPDDLRDRKIARLNADLIDRVTIESAGQPKIVLAREENRWRFLSPANAPANANSVNRLIQEMNKDEVTEFVSDTATDLARYGLEQPKLKFTFSSYSSENTAESDAGEVILSTLEFGNSQHGLTYGRLKEEPYIFSISDQLIADMPKTKFSFRSLDILDLKRDELVSVQVKKTGEEPVDLVRGATGKWILKGSQNRQDEGRMQVFLTALTGLRAAAWAGDPSPEFGFDQPSLEIRISYESDEQKRQAEIWFGKTNSGDQHYGMSTEEEGVFLVDEEQFEQLQALSQR